MKIIQLLDALDYGDGVSNDVINLRAMLTKMGIQNEVYSKWYDKRVERYTKDIDKYQPDKNDLIIFHFSGESHILERVIRYPCRCIVRYHNVTPPEFFLPNNLQAYQHCKAGLEQIKAHIEYFDGFLADSPFNASNLISYGANRHFVDVLPIVFDFDRIDQIKLESNLQEKLQRDIPYILFVGRVAPNKRLEDILDIFEIYCRRYGRRMKLYFVGNDSQDTNYRDMLQQKMAEMAAKKDVIFTGKVSSSELYTYYHSASAFICMSEHEGFCIPLLEAQYFDVPVIAFASCAVPDTMGKSGVLLYKKDPVIASAVLERILSDSALRASIQKKQRENLQQYQKSAVESRLFELLKRWGVL